MGIITFVSKAGCGSVWLERHLREVEAASSNLVTPIKLNSGKYRRIKGVCGIFALKGKVPISNLFYLLLSSNDKQIGVEIRVENLIKFLGVDNL